MKKIKKQVKYPRWFTVYSSDKSVYRCDGPREVYRIYGGRKCFLFRSFSYLYVSRLAQDEAEISAEQARKVAGKIACALKGV